MKICGLITEYNPFHNGHVHHMKEAREKTGADYLVVVMSGDFVQRGAPAIIDQYQRTKMALDGGADLVLQLPAPFSTSSAEIFSKAAVNLLHQLGCVDAIAFGAERGSAGDNGSVEDLKKIAEVLNSEPYEFKQDLREYIKTGFNYPTARAMALEDYFEGGIEDLQDLLEKPNNILAIEYLRALDKLRSSMKPYLIKRWKTDYHSEQLYQDVASATAVRKLLYQGKEIDAIAPYVTPMVRDIFDAEYGKSTPVRVNDFSAILQYTAPDGSPDSDPSPTLSSVPDEVS
ncbi:MAG: nucleotidyltransferase family protein [Lachnospiraceae bacterium]|nr:nucleotidyltransferase family protein [Lachnospiraceae bacterium]